MADVYKNSIHISNDTSNLKTVRAFLAEGIVVSGMVPKEWQNKITLAVDEAVTNIIEHGYEADEDGHIDITIEASAERFVAIINDSGRSYNPTGAGEIDMDEHVKAQRTGGLGIFIMRRIMDEIKYAFKEGEQNELMMVKYFRP